MSAVRQSTGAERIPLRLIDKVVAIASAQSAVSSLDRAMRCCAAGMRASVAILCTLVILALELKLNISTVAILFAYIAWSLIVLYREANGRTPRQQLLHYWVDVVWSVAILGTTSESSTMMVLTLVQPVILASIGFGSRHGVALALFAIVDLLREMFYSPSLAQLKLDPECVAETLAALLLVPVALLVGRPMNLLRQRLELVHQIAGQLDPRRGLNSVATVLAQGLCRGIDADAVGLLVRPPTSELTLLSVEQSGGFPVNPETMVRVEHELDRLPDCPSTYVVPRWLGLHGGARLHGDYLLRHDPVHEHALDELAKLFKVRMVVVVPLTRRGHRLGCVVVWLRQPRNRFQEVESLAAVASDLIRVAEQAALADRLQDEVAAHERMRIGRDLHDSAIQPYLGLKYAVEFLSSRVAADDLLRPDMDKLIDIVNSEIGSLREIISGIRSGKEGGGDNSLIPALRRQVRRFGQLFGLEVELDSADELLTSRALAGSIFHSVNEALNNIRKHSLARHVWIALRRGDGHIELRVRDDAGAQQGHAQADFQPRSLMDRIAAVGGTFTLHRPDGLNTEIVVTIPTRGTGLRVGGTA